MRYKRCVVVAVVFGLLTVTSVPLPLSAPIAAEPAGAVVFEDDFNGPRGAVADSQMWRNDVGGTGWGNNELQYYTRRGNTFLDGGGNLVIEAHDEGAGHTCFYGPCRFTSGKLTTKSHFAQRYGRFEARMNAPAQQGLWAAFWMLGDNIDLVGHPECGEIDVMETLGRKSAAVEQHAHGPGMKYGGPYILPAGQSFAGWHTYAVDWTPDAIEWQVDGRSTLTLTRDRADASWVFDRPFYLLVNLAVGGDWPGSPNADTVFPARLLIDYVRVYENPD